MKYLCLFILLFNYSIARASYVEAFGQRSILKSKSKLFGSTDFSTTNNQWSDSYRSLATHLSLNLKSQIHSIGFLKSLNTTTNERSYFYYRYDYLNTKNSSFSLKYSHRDWFFVNSATESIELAFNIYNSLKNYISIGYYQRWLNQNWNSQTHTPFSFGTEDNQGFLSVVVGWNLKLGSSNITLDINNRDEFSYYKSDNWALDLNYYGKINNLSIKLLLGTRFGGLFGLSPMLTTTYSSIGVMY